MERERRTDRPPARAHPAPDRAESDLPAFAPPAKDRPLAGAALMTLAALMFSAMNGLVRLAADLGFPPLQIAFLRSLFALLVMAPIIAPVVLREGPAWLKTTRPGLFLVRGLAAAVGVIGWMSALATLPLAEATAITFTAPLIATAGSALILGETVRLRRWSAILIGFIGVLVILRPGMAAVEVGALWALTAAAGMASAALLVKTLTRTEPAQRIVLYTSLMLTALTAVPAALVWVPMTPAMWAIGAGIGAIGALSQIALTKAFESADASVVLPFDYARLPFTALIGWVFFAQVSDLVTWAGALLIAGAALYVARREHQAARR
ncbi:MAG: DMT family transporter [Marivibrio sp.]|uniref:DMT family transporter n=1 Tax=Marivibrio sp. TaxID=2039719 RepID=UPI0032ED895E